MKYIIALLLTFGAFAAQATTPTKRISLDIGRPENTFVLGPISRGSSEYIDCALYVRGTAYPTNDLSGSLWYSVANTSTSGVSISTVDADVINGHVYIQMSVTDSLGLSTTEADYPITYYASVVLTNATQTHVFDVGTLVLRWDAATAGAGSATLSNGAQPTYFTALTDTPSSYTGQGGKVVSVNTGGTALEFTTAGSGSGDLTEVQVSGSILTVASGTGPIPIVGLTTAAVQAAQITYTAGTNLILSATEFSLDGSGVASLALADSALQSYTETDPIWVAVSNTVTANALLGSTALPLAGGTMTGNISMGGLYSLTDINNIILAGSGTPTISNSGELSLTAWMATIDATTGNQIVGWSVLTNQIALLSPAGGTYTGGTNVDVNGTIINLDAAAVASDVLANSALQNVVEDTTPTLGGNLDGGALDMANINDIAASQMELTHTATSNEEHAIELIVDAGAFADVRALDIEYDAGTLTNGQEDAVMLININDFDALGGSIFAKEVLTTEGLSTVWGAKYGPQVGPFLQDSGTFAAMDSALVNAVNELADLLNSATNTSIFVADNDTVTIGDAAKFSDIEFILSTVASGAGITPTFEYSLGIGTWATFTPTDGTTGMKFTGLVAWDTDDIPSWATGTGTEYLIRITRTRNTLSTTPIAQLVQISQTVPFYWDEDGAVQALSFAGIGSGLTALNASQVTSGTLPNARLVNIDETNLDASANASLDLADSALQTTDLSGAAVNEVLTYSAAGWTNAPAGGGATPAFTNAAGNTYSVADLSGAQDGNGIVYSFTLGGWTNSANRVMQNGDSPTALDATAWRTLYSDGSGNITELAFGTSGQHLKSNGASSAPTWETPSAGGGSQTPWTNNVDAAGFALTALDYTSMNTNAAAVTGVAAKLVQYVLNDRLYSVYDSVTNYAVLN